MSKEPAMQASTRLIPFAKRCIQSLATLVLAGLTVAMMVFCATGHNETISISRVQHSKADSNANATQAVCFSIQPEKIELLLNLDLIDHIRVSYRRESRAQAT
jgi:hypothetical protein